MNTQEITTQDGLWVEISKITIPENVRKHTQEDIDSRANSMARDGQLENILLSMEDGKLVLVYGNGRLESAKKLGWEKIRADVKEGLTESQKLLMILAENEERENAGPFFTAQLFNRIMAAEKLTSEQLPDYLKKSRATVYNYLALLTLPAEVKAMSTRVDIGIKHWQEIGKLQKPEEQVQLAQECAEKDYSVRELQVRVKQLLNPKASGTEPKPPAEVKPFQFSWKDGTLLVKAAYKPGEGNFFDFTCDMEHAYNSFVDLHPQPQAKQAA